MERLLADERFRTIVENLADYCIFTTDLHGIVTSWNVGCERTFGWTSEEFIGSSAHRIFVPEDRVQNAAAIELQTALRDGRAEDERWHHRKDGSRFWASGLLLAYRDEDGNVAGFVKVLRDKTAEYLDSQVREALAREREVLIKSLREANGVKDEILGFVSHELRTPLTLIGGNADLLARRWRELDEDTVGAAIEEIRQQADVLNTIVSDMLLLARLTPSQTVTEPVLLSPLIAKAVASHQSRHPMRPVQFQAPDSCPPAAGHTGYLEQVFRNLLDNSEKYAAIGTPFEISLEPMPQEVAATFRDRGRRLSQAEVERFFEPFFRSPGPASISGLGLGLAVCRRLVEAQQGRITAAPRLGGGLEVKIALPRADLGEEPTASEATA